MGEQIGGQIDPSRNNKPGASIFNSGNQSRSFRKIAGDPETGALARPHVSRILSIHSDGLLDPDQQQKLGSFVTGILQTLASVEKLSRPALFKQFGENHVDGAEALQALVDWGYVQRDKTGDLTFLVLPADVRAEVHETLRGPWDGLDKAKPVK